MPNYLPSAVRFDSAQRRLSALTVAAVRREWARMDPGSFERSWETVGPRIVVLLMGAQTAATKNGMAYVPAVLSDQDYGGKPDATINPRGFVGVASDGRSLDGLVYGSVVNAGRSYGATGDTATALASGGSWLDVATVTQTWDAFRAVTSVGITAHSHGNIGYIRQLKPPSCSNCALLAGKWYGWNIGFERHKACDCIHVPVAEASADPLKTDPKAYFNSLSKTEQDKRFTQAGAQAIRDGADMGQVVNARLGATGLTPAGRITEKEAIAIRNGNVDYGHLRTTDLYGHPVYTTTAGTTYRSTAGKRLGAKRGGPAPVRLMPESIYQIAEDRTHALELLHKYGFIL